jgi:hypothetical protein
MGMFDTVTGKAVEEKMREYTEVYGQVLVGIHQDIQKQAMLLKECRVDLAAQRTRLQLVTTISVLAVAIALIAGGLWISR